MGLPSEGRVDLLQLILKSIQVHLPQCKMKEETEDGCSKTVMVIFDSVFLSIVGGLNDIDFSFDEGRDIPVTSHFLGFRDLQTELP